MSLLQDQLKFVYDTLEEFVLCGHTYFPAKEISQRLKEKSGRPPGSKLNEYEREYAVRPQTTTTTLVEIHRRKLCSVLYTHT